MKKYLLALLCAVMLLSVLAGCGGGEDASATDVSATDVSATDVAETGAPQAADPEASADPTMTVSESVAKLRGFSPAVLGLEGTTMTSYHIYPAEESVKVDGVTCAKLRVYHSSETAATNEIAGVYLLSRDGTRLFRLDPNTETVEEIEIA